MQGSIGNLDSFLYQYLVGGALFAFGIWCGVKSGAMAPRNTEGRSALWLLVGGFLLLALLHAAFVFFGK